MRKNTKEDVWKFVDKKDNNSCWNWIGSTFLSTGYGRFFYQGKALVAHRFVYQLINGAIDTNIMVMHKCNNKPCCNPLHLTIGTNSQNQNHASMSRLFSTGKTGIRGVGFVESRGYWTATAYENGKKINLYTGPHKEKAVKARKSWEDKNGITFNI